jgi:SpoIIAA-like
MLTLIPDLPADVIAVEAREKVTAEDYETVLVPAVEAAKASGADKLKILYVLDGEFPDYTAGAVWQDTKLGLGHLRSWERIAVVSDAEWLHRSIAALGWAVPGEIKVFGSSEAAAAREWVCR